MISVRYLEFGFRPSTPTHRRRTPVEGEDIELHGSDAGWFGNRASPREIKRWRDPFSHALALYDDDGRLQYL
jgi:hypothetical protein